MERGTAGSMDDSSPHHEAPPVKLSTMNTIRMNPEASSAMTCTSKE